MTTFVLRLRRHGHVVLILAVGVGGGGIGAGLLGIDNQERRRAPGLRHPSAHPTLKGRQGVNVGTI